MPQFTVSMSDEEFTATLEAVCGVHEWTPTIPNPAFKESEPESDENPREVPNTPPTAGEFLVQQIGRNLAAYRYQWQEQQRQAALQAPAVAPESTLQITVSEG